MLMLAERESVGGKGRVSRFGLGVTRRAMGNGSVRYVERRRGEYPVGGRKVAGAKLICDGTGANERVGERVQLKGERGEIER